LTAAEAAERDAKQRNKQKKKNSEATASLPSNPSPFASSFTMLVLKPRDRLKGSKNQTFVVSIAFDESSFSFASTVMTRTTKSGRAVKETIV